MHSVTDWPEDETFKKFARLVADKVTVFINNGGKIAPTDTGIAYNECSCPLGTVNGSRYPYLILPESIFGCKPQEAQSFANAFDDNNHPTRDAYARLGRAYRERFGYANG
jgi:hypothetical protein